MLRFHPNTRRAHARDEAHSHPHMPTSTPHTHNTHTQAVDLYVLERALESTHIQEGLMDKVIMGYNESKRAASTLAKLADVRMRGRKRVMVG
jgi:tRNA A-37 threonylcarbamoyl transferase component Bud32